MKTGMCKVLMVGYVSVLWAPVWADSLITPVAATAESYYRANYDTRAPVCTINGSYMSPIPVTASSAASMQYRQGMWLSNGTKATWITYDLGNEMTVTGMHVWNYNEVNYAARGIKTCDLYAGTYMLSSGMPYGLGGAAWGTFVESLTFACAPGAEPYYGEDIWFTEPVTTRYLQLLVRDNYGIDNYTGLSEVRFYSRTSQRWSFTGESAVSFAVRSDDLLQTAVVSTVDELSVNNTENEKYSKGTLASLTDGTFGPAGHVDGLCIAGGQVTYQLDTETVPGGYDIAEVD
ncbi:MAG: discoidin domain-containing protein, partial [Kiritimatiellae bacterium]|nr:discoidin domain-containing protein [Kiritimatiellia bacterium]